MRMDTFTKQILDELLEAMTSKQRLFVHEYMVDKNKTAAYKRAGYTGQGINANTAACALFRNVQVSAAIQILENAQLNETKITAKRVLEEMAKSAFADLHDYLDWTSNGVTLKPKSDLTRDQTAAIAEISVVPGKYGDTVKFKLNNKEKNLEMLARHLKLLTGDQIDEEDEVEPVQVIINAVNASES